jgi:hypothetical protein
MEDEGSEPSFAVGQRKLKGGKGASLKGRPFKYSRLDFLLYFFVIRKSGLRISLITYDRRPV